MHSLRVQCLLKDLRANVVIGPYIRQMSADDDRTLASTFWGERWTVDSFAAPLVGRGLAPAECLPTITVPSAGQCGHWPLQSVHPYGTGNPSPTSAKCLPTMTAPLPPPKGGGKGAAKNCPLSIVNCQLLFVDMPLVRYFCSAKSMKFRFAEFPYVAPRQRSFHINPLSRPQAYRSPQGNIDGQRPISKIPQGIYIAGRSKIALRVRAFSVQIYR